MFIPNFQRKQNNLLGSVLGGGLRRRRRRRRRRRAFFKFPNSGRFSRQTCWFAVLVGLTHGGSDDKLSTSQGNGAEILSEHSVGTKN